MEYSPAEVDAFIEFADACEEEFQGIMVDGVEVGAAAATKASTAAARLVRALFR